MAIHIAIINRKVEVGRKCIISVWTAKIDRRGLVIGTGCFGIRIVLMDEFAASRTERLCLI